MEIETGRLRLTPFAAEDLLALLESEQSFQASFGNPAAAGLRGFYVCDEVDPGYVEMLQQSSGFNPWQWGFAMIEKESDIVVGTAGFKGPPDTAGMVEIAYGVVPASQNRGFATEAVGGLITFLVHDPKVRCLRAHTLPQANASTRVLQKNGFANAGKVTDPEDGPVWRWERMIESHGRAS